MTGGNPFLRDIAAAVAFVVFVLALALLAPRRRTAAPEATQQSRVGLLLLVTLLLSFGAGLTQRDLWPFSNWPIKALTPLPDVSALRILGVDADGTEHRIDPRAWEPLGLDELTPWLIYRFPSLDPDGQQRAARHLLDRAEQAREAARAGRRIGRAGRILGPFAAPSFVLHPRPWSDPRAVPAQPLVALRLYQETWSLAERRRDPERYERNLLYEHRP